MIINGGTLSRYAMFREVPVESQTLTDPVGAVRFLKFQTCQHSGALPVSGSVDA